MNICMLNLKFDFFYLDRKRCVILLSLIKTTILQAIFFFFFLLHTLELHIHSKPLFCYFAGLADLGPFNLKMRVYDLEMPTFLDVLPYI